MAQAFCGGNRHFATAFRVKSSENICEWIGQADRFRVPAVGFRLIFALGGVATV
jgi:predicted transcriptional regulator of viral defense system